MILHCFILEYRKIDMIGHAKRSEVLKLQSYKLDNQALVSKINELNELKS